MDERVFRSSIVHLWGLFFFKSWGRSEKDQAGESSLHRAVGREGIAAGSPRSGDGGLGWLGCRRLRQCCPNSSQVGVRLGISYDTLPVSRRSLCGTLASSSWRNCNRWLRRFAEWEDRFRAAFASHGSGESDELSPESSFPAPDGT